MGIKAPMPASPVLCSLLSVVLKTEKLWHGFPVRRAPGQTKTEKCGIRKKPDAAKQQDEERPAVFIVKLCHVEVIFLCIDGKNAH